MTETKHLVRQNKKKSALYLIAFGACLFSIRLHGKKAYAREKGGRFVVGGLVRCHLSKGLFEKPKT